MVWAVAMSGSSLSSRLHWLHHHVNALVKELETGRERERHWRREGRLQGQRANPILLTTNQSGGVLRCLGGNRGGNRGGGEEEEEVSKERREGGWTARRIPRVNYPREGGTVANTLHLICKAAAKVHLSTASERLAIAPRQLMSPFNDMCFSVWQWLGSCGLGQLAKRKGLSDASCLPRETNFR